MPRDGAIILVTHKRQAHALGSNADLYTLEQRGRDGKVTDLLAEVSGDCHDVRRAA